MAIDLSNEKRDELIPEGVYRLQAEVMPGGYGPGETLKQSSKGTLAYLNVCNHVLEGPHKGRRIYDKVMVEPLGSNPTDGEQLSVRIGRTRVRRIVESARAVDVGNETAEAIREKLTIGGWGDLHGLVYCARVGVEEANGKYDAKNVIERIITPCDPDWPGTPIMPVTPLRPLVIAQPKSPEKDMDDEIPF